MKPETIQKFNDKLQALKEKLGSDMKLTFIKAKAQKIIGESVECEYNLIEGDIEGNFSVDFSKAQNFKLHPNNVDSIYCSNHRLRCHVSGCVSEALHFGTDLVLPLLLRKTFTAQDCQELLDAQQEQPS